MGEGKELGAPGRPDDPLLLAVARGDPAAFTHFHTRFGPGIVALFRRRTSGQGERSDELAQETWSLVWQSLSAGRYDPARAAFSTFVYAVAHHVWLRQGRSRQPGRTTIDLAAAEPLSDAALTADSLAYAELITALRDCIAVETGPHALDVDEKAIVIGLSNGETERSLAGQLGLAPSTINARKQSAIAKLRGALAGRGFSAEIVEQMTGRGE